MAPFSGKQRVDAAFEGILADRVPSCPITGRCNAQLIAASTREFLTDPKIMVKAQIAAYELYKPDILVMKGDSLMEAEAMGNEIEFPEDSICFSTRVALEDKGKLNSLNLPDPTRDGRMQGYLEAVTEVNKIVTDSEIFAFVTGPWTIAIELRRAEELIRDAKNDPVFFHELMGFTARMCIQFGEALLPIIGRVNFSECNASSSFIFPKMYRELIFPYHKQIVDHFKEKKVGVGLHICGYADPILEDIVCTGVTIISIDAPTDLARAVDVAGGRAVLMGNVDTGLFSYGEREDMKRAIENCIHITGRNSAYVLASGCEVPGSASPEKVGWFMELLNELGRYDDSRSDPDRCVARGYQVQD